MSNDQLRHKVTQGGKPRARWTMKCSFQDGNEFTYRDDDQLIYFQSKGYKNISSLDALVLRFALVKKKSSMIEIFDNAMPPGHDRKVHFLAGRVMLNELLMPGTQIRYNL